MQIKITIPTDEQFEEIKKGERNDWSPIYAALAQYGRILVGEVPTGLRTSLYSHYAKTRKKPHFVPTEDGQFLIYIEAR